MATSGKPAGSAPAFAAPAVRAANAVPRLLGEGDASDDPLGVPGQIPDDGVELAERDPQTAHTVERTQRCSVASPRWPPRWLRPFARRSKHRPTRLPPQPPPARR